MLVTAGVLAVVVVVVGASAGSVLLAAGRAQDAADAAALAAAHAAEASPSAPDAAARSAAAAHGADLETCDCAGPVVSVTVRVPVTARPARALGIATRAATAHARLLPLGARASLGVLALPHAAGGTCAPGRTLAARSPAAGGLVADRIVGAGTSQTSTGGS